MDLLMGAMGNLAPKLLQLLGDEYKLQKGLRKKVEFVLQELESTHSALRKVAQVPRDQLDEQVKVWASQVREASYDMEDILDSFLVHVEGCEASKESRLKQILKKMSGLFGKVKARHDIAGAIDDIEKQLQVVAQRRDRCKVDMIVAKPAATSTIDPRLVAMHTEVTQLIGIDKSRCELISKLSLQDDGNDSNGKTKIVSVVGVGGLGKTTLAKVVYDQLKPCFSCGAFVPIGRNADLKKVFRDILIDLDKETYINVKYDILDVRQLINELRDFLGNKRYFIVIDDVWDATTWKTIKSAFNQKNSGSRVITTTRNREVSSSEEAYELEILSYGNSKKLFYTRLYGGEAECPANHPDEASEKILRKCGGVPLAIITMASFLVGKSSEYWFDMCNSPGFYRGKGNQQQVDDTEWILSLSYYDLPPNLKTCLLYLSVYPEDYEIEKRSLIWRWIAEGFIERKTGTSLFQRGEEYFHELINRSMIQLVEIKSTGIIYGCRVHDMVLDLIRGLSEEENFVTIISNNVDHGTSSSSRNKVRRLAHQKRIMNQITQHDSRTTAMATVRSLVACSCDIESWVMCPSFILLRVLALEKCSVPPTGWQGLKHIGNLLHLRYLGLRSISGDYQLPEEVGKLKFLQTLDLDYFYTGVLPMGICQLTQLVCLRGGVYTKAPDGLLTTMKSLEELCISIDSLNDESKRQFMKDLGNLSEARVLYIIGTLEGVVQSELVQSLGKLYKLQDLILVDYNSGGQSESGEWGTVVLPRHLQNLCLGSIGFHRLPLWMSPAHFPSLYWLRLKVDHLDEAGLRALGGLPELRYLELVTLTASTANISTTGDGFFKKLRCFMLFDCMVQLVLNNEDPTSVSFSIWNGKGAMAFGTSRTESDEHISRSVVAPAVTVMPSLQELWFEVPLKALYTDGNGSCDNLGLQYLPSLLRVRVTVNCEGASAGDVEKAEAALRQAEKLHPNKPVFQIRRSGYKTFQSLKEKEGETSSAGDQVAVTPSG